jgi:hypothetical protein
MRKILLATVMLLAGTFHAEAQRQPQVDANGNPVVRNRPAGGTGTGTAPTTTRTQTTPTPQPPKPTVVVRPTQPPAPVVVQKKVFVPVAVPRVQAWNSGNHSYPRARHRECQEKAHRLHSYERHAANDGYLSSAERRNINVLQRDLDRTCGGHRWR